MSMPNMLLLCNASAFQQFVGGKKCLQNNAFAGYTVHKPQELVQASTRGKLFFVGYKNKKEIFCRESVESNKKSGIE